MQLCWLLDRKSLFNRIWRIDVKSHPFAHAFMGVGFKVVRESAVHGLQEFTVIWIPAGKTMVKKLTFLRSADRRSAGQCGSGPPQRPWSEWPRAACRWRCTRRCTASTDNWCSCWRCRGNRPRSSSWRRSRSIFLQKNPEKQLTIRECAGIITPVVRHKAEHLGD